MFGVVKSILKPTGDSNLWWSFYGTDFNYFVDP